MRKVVPLSLACQVVSRPFEPVAFDVDGYQGDFPDKLFCKLSRRRKCKNEQSAITLPCLPVFFAQYDLCPTWVQVRINFCSNWAEVEFGTSAQFGWRCTGFLFPTWEYHSIPQYWTTSIGGYLSFRYAVCASVSGLFASTTSPLQPPSTFWLIRPMNL